MRYVLVVLLCVGQVSGSEPIFKPTGIYAEKAPTLHDRLPPVPMIEVKTPTLLPPPKPKLHNVDQHSHTCPKCGNRWWHSDSSFGSTAAHKCPKCGAMQWQQDAGHRTVQVPVQAFVKPMVQSSSCPNGNCPVPQARFRRR